MSFPLPLCSAGISSLPEAMLGVKELVLLAVLVNPLVNGYRGDEDQDGRLMDLLRRVLDLQTEKAEKLRSASVSQILKGNTARDA